MYDKRRCIAPVSASESITGWTDTITHYRLDGIRKRYKTGDGGYDDTPSKWMGNDGDEEKVKGVPKAA